MSNEAPIAYRGSFEVPASPTTVFEFLTKDDLLTQWWPDNAETDPVEGVATTFPGMVPIGISEANT